MRKQDHSLNSETQLANIRNRLLVDSEAHAQADWDCHAPEALSRGPSVVEEASVTAEM